MKIITSAALALAIAAAGFHAPASASEHIVLNYIGQQIVSNKTRFNGTLIGGLSSLDYNPATDRYLAISDDRSNARFYELSLDLSLFQRSATPGMDGVKFH
ncbi:MAG: esterase-like activity of phytase family protein, partial [Nitrosospira sp.]|nr:esterase-like activity of phytase family protein [Nitrosospira sp.]